MPSPKTRRALGRGLSSLIPVASEGAESGTDITVLGRDSIRTNPFQPRIDFDEEEIRRLAESIRAQGLLQPVIVRKRIDGYEIISGERRFRALEQLGQQTVPCIVKEDVTDREMLEIALVENIQRQDLNEIEKATAYQRLLDDCGLSHEQLSEHVGTSRSAVTNTLRLLKLPRRIQEMVRRGGLSMGHARALIAIEDTAKQEKLADRIIAHGLSVRDVERLVQGGGRAKKRTERRGPASVDPDIQQLLEKLQYHFGTSVGIVPRRKGGGKVEISYYNSEDLGRIIEILLR